MSTLETFTLKSHSDRRHNQNSVRCPIRDTVARLRRLGLLKVDANGTLKKSDAELKIESSARNAALQYFHEQMMDKSKEKLGEFGTTERLVGSYTFGFCKDQLPKLEMILKEALEKIAVLSERESKKDIVYYCGVQLVPLCTPN